MLSARLIMVFFEKIANLRLKIDIFNVYSFGDGLGTNHRHLGGRGRTINKDYRLISQNAQPGPAAAGVLSTDGDTILFQKRNKLI